MLSVDPLRPSLSDPPSLLEKPMTLSLKPLFSAEDIAQRVQALAYSINQDYHNTPLTVVGILKGSWIFMADLVRSLTIPIENLEFLQLSSYGDHTTSSGKVEILLNLTPDSIRGKHLLMIEDIIDTGFSLQTTLDLLSPYHPASLRICTLLDKPSRRQIEVKIDYYGFQIADDFVVGYGLDYQQKYRHLPALYTITPHF